MADNVRRFGGIPGAVPQPVRRRDLSGLESLEELLQPTTDFDASSRRAGMRKFLEGCKGRGSPIVMRIDDALRVLSELSAPGASLENHRVHELWGRLNEVGEKAVADGQSIPFAMAPILRERSSAKAYELFVEGLKRYLFDTIFADYGARLDRILEMLESDSVADEVTAVIMAREELISMTEELETDYRKDLEGFFVLNGVFSKVVRALYVAERYPDTSIRRVWRHSFGTAADLTLDGDAMLHSFDISLLLFTHYCTRADLGLALGSCRMPEAGSVGSIIRRVVSLNQPRASVRRIGIYGGKLPVTNVPCEVRNDLFRALNIILINAIRTADLAKEDRIIEISCSEKGAAGDPSSILEIVVDDNGKGVDGNVAAEGDYNGWFSRFRRIAMWHGWIFELWTARSEGTRIALRINVGNWGGDPLRAEEEKRTIPGLGPSTVPFQGLVESGDGMDAAPTPTESEVDVFPGDEESLVEEAAVGSAAVVVANAISNKCGG